MNKKTILGLVCLFIWILVIFLFSGSDASSSTAQTQIVLNMLSELAEKNDFFNFIFSKLGEKYGIFYSIRKLAHLTVFCILQLISFYIFRNNGKSILKATIYSLLIVIGYATVDEIHQYFVPGRSCQITDVMIDTLGGITGLIICYSVISIKKIIITIKDILNR